LLTLFKTAEPDRVLAARVVLRDWNTGKFPRFTLPPSSPSVLNIDGGVLAKVYSKDDSVLSQLKTRSEFRRAGGLVRMNSGEINQRNLVLDAEWASPEDSEPSEDGDGDGEMIDFCGNEGDEEDGEDGGDETSEDEEDEEDGEEQEDDDESEIEPPPLPSKRKRPAEPSKGLTAPPKKKVTFDLPKSAKGAGFPSKTKSLYPNSKKRPLTPKKR
jgi:nuclear GTP-binding protein